MWWKWTSIAILQRVFIKDGEEVNVVVVKEPMISGVLTGEERVP